MSSDASEPASAPPNLDQQLATLIAEINEIKADAYAIKNDGTVGNYYNHLGWQALQTRLVQLGNDKARLDAKIDAATDPKAQGNFNEIHVMLQM